MYNKIQFLFFSFSCLILLNIRAQDTTSTEDDNVDYSLFADASGVKRFATQKVVNQSPTKILSLGYEYQANFVMPAIPFDDMLNASQDDSVRRVSGFRAQLNLPVISNDRIIWQMGFNYWGSRFEFRNRVLNRYIKQLSDPGLVTAGINTTIFKPLNEKHFLIIQASLDANLAFRQAGDLNAKAVTISATALYGWKKSDKNLIGTGVARTYRAGRIIHVPVLLWNRTFSDQWGMELLFPARAHLRRNFSATNMLQVGCELEGNQYFLPDGNRYLQRGEFKPRMQWDKKISGFLWFQVQAGLRLNWRFDVMKSYNGFSEQQKAFTTAIGNPFFFGFSLNIVSP
jgi:hypothetical protein